MKKRIIFVLCMILFATAYGQSKTSDSKEVSNVTLPKFTGGENVVSYLNTDNSVLMDRYLKEKLVCPMRVVECCAEGTEVVQFTVSPSGKITDIKVINSVCPELDKEVIRVLKTTEGMWQPGLENGEPVAMNSEIEFMLGDYPSKSCIVEHFNRSATKYFNLGSRYFVGKGNPKKALKCYNEAIRYIPKDKAILYLRGLCHYKLGDTKSAQRDWNRIIELGGIEPEQIDKKTAGMKGYKEMNEILYSK